MPTLIVHNATLPAECYGTLPNGAIIKIHAGEEGYFPIPDRQGIAQLKNTNGCATYSDLADFLNQEENITKAQRAAMEFGSMWGWDSMLADPANYLPTGLPDKARLATIDKKNEPWKTLGEGPW